MSDAALKRLKVIIDKAACCGYGICNEICPEVYKLDGNGIVYVDDPIVPEGMEDSAREGCDACPQSVLELVEA